MEHQRRALEFIKDRPFTALFFETGTGKTPVGLWALEHWYHAFGLRRMVAIVPNTLTGNWIDEAARFGCTLRYARAVGSREKRLETINDPDWDVLVINYESTRGLWADIVAQNPQGLLLDELQRVKDRRSQQSKAARQIARAVKHNNGRIIGLTGTPIVHRPTDLWSEFDILWPSDSPMGHALGYGNYWAFESQVAIVRPHPHLGSRVKLYSFPADRLEKLRGRVAPHALEATKDECLDLPERVFQVLRVDLGPEQRKLYDALRDDFVAFLENRPTAPKAEAVLERHKVPPIDVKRLDAAAFLDGADFGEDRRVSVAFATTLLIRLQQITSGFAVADDRSIVELPNAKLDLLSDMLPDWTVDDHKCVIFFKYRHELNMLAKLCESMRLPYTSLTGDNSDEAHKVVKHFQTEKDCKIFLGNLQVASVGITLTAADFCCFYSNSFSLGDRLQAIDRLYRIGQKRSVTYYDLLARQTVDESILANLKDKKKLADLTVGNLLAAIRN